MCTEHKFCFNRIINPATGKRAERKMERPETVRRTRRSKKQKKNPKQPPRPVSVCVFGRRNWRKELVDYRATSGQNEWTDRTNKKKRRKHRLPMKMESESSDGRQGKGNERKRTMNTMRTPQLGNNGRGHEFLNNNQLIDPSGCKTIDIRCIRLLSTITRCRP